MEIKRIQESVNEIATEEEINKMQLDFARLKASKFLFPLSKEEFFNLYLFYRLVEDRISRDLFDLKYSQIKNQDVTAKQLKDATIKYTNHKTEARKIQDAFEAELERGKITFDVEAKTTELIQVLKFIDEHGGGQTKKYLAALEAKEKLINEFDCIIKGSEPGGE